MSTFLGFSSALVSLGTSVSTLQATFSSLMAGYGWQIVRQAVLPTTIGGNFTNTSYAFDGVSTTAASSTTVPVYVSMYLAAGFTPTAMYVQAEYISGTIYSPMTFNLEWSPDGSSWTILQTWTNQINWGYGERRKFTISGAISKPYWRLNVLSVSSGTSCYLGEFCLEDTNGNWLTNNNFFDMIPPVTETIGNSFSRECVRWSFNAAGTSMSLRPVQEFFTATPQVISFDTWAAGGITSNIILPIAGCSGGTASFATNVMTLQTAPTTGTLMLGSNITSAGVAPGTYITSLASGTLNAIGSTYTLSTSPGTITTQAFTTTVGSSGGTASFATNVMTLQTAPTTGQIAIGQSIIPPNGVTYYILALASGTMNAVGSTYTLSGSPGTFATLPIATNAPSVSQGWSASFATNVMTITVAPTSGGLTLGQTVMTIGGSGLPVPGTTILSLASGTLNAIGSTYTLSTTPGTLVAQSMVSMGNPIIVPGTTGYTSAQNSRTAYELCKANPSFSGWNWIYPVPGIASTAGGANIIAVAKTPAMNIGAGSLQNTQRSYASSRGTSMVNVPFVQTTQQAPASSLTIDLYNGFIYYLQVCSRGIAVASKTNASFYTPLHACYGDNASALVQIPTADLAPYGLPCTISELFVGLDEVVANSGGLPYPTHWWGVAGAFNLTYMDGYLDYSNHGDYANYSHHAIPGQMQDFASNASLIGALPTSQATAAGEFVFSGADSGSIFSIHRLGITSQGPIYNTIAGATYAKYFGPSFLNLDWYKFTGTAPANEQLVVGPSLDYSTTITANGTMSDSVLNVTSTAGFPGAGWLVLETEIIQYTGTTSNTFTGCTRGKYNSSEVSPLAGTTIYIGAWWVFMVQGLIFVGYQTPS